MAIGTKPETTAQSGFGYDKDTDYSKLMEEAAANGDYVRAAIYEAQRNEKIAGEGLNYQTFGKVCKLSARIGSGQAGICESVQGSGRCGDCRA